MSNITQQPVQIPLSKADNELAAQLLQNYKGNILSILSNLQQITANSLDELINDKVVLGAQLRLFSQENQSQKAIIENLTKEITILKNQGKEIPRPAVGEPIPEPTSTK